MPHPQALQVQGRSDHLQVVEDVLRDVPACVVLPIRVLLASGHKAAPMTHPWRRQPRRQAAHRCTYTPCILAASAQLVARGTLKAGCRHQQKGLLSQESERMCYAGQRWEIASSVHVTEQARCLA